VPDFDVLSWFKKHIEKPTLNENELKTTRNFTLMWSLFEHTYFTEEKNQTLNVQRLKALAFLSKGIIQQEDYKDFILFFNKRYFQNGDKGKERFKNLRLHQDEFEDVKNIVKNYNEDEKLRERILEALFLIAHRFRNNLFHGNKSPINLQIYEECFDVLNRF